MTTQPETDAGRALVAAAERLSRKWGTTTRGETETFALRVPEIVLTIEREAFWNGVKSVEEVHNPQKSG